MEFLSIIFSGIVSLCVSIAVNLFLDRVRKRAANRERIAELSLKFLQELTSNYKKVQRYQPVETEVIRRMISTVALNPDIRRVLDSLCSLFDAYNERVLAGEDIVDLGIEKAMLSVYAQPFLSNGIRVGIIYSPKFRHHSDGVYGHWGIASPAFFRKQLKNFSCCDISPYNYESILECDIVINPYGEAWVLKNCEENTILKALNTLEEFLVKGGIWIHTGGFPFHFVCDPSGRVRVKVGGEIRKRLGLSFIAVPSDVESPELTKEAKLILGDVDLSPGAGYRVCTNADRVWIKVASGAVVGFKKIGEGGIFFQGGLFYKPVAKELPLSYYIIRIINLLCLEGKVYHRRL